MLGYLQAASSYYVTPSSDKNHFMFEISEDEGVEEDHQILILFSNIGSLQKRIDIIRKAKKTIDLEYFIWKVDDLSSLIIVNELIKKLNLELG